MRHAGALLVQSGMQLVAKMVCKFHADMTSSPHTLLLALTASLVLAGAASPAFAEKADRLKKMEITADQPGKVDIQKKIVTFNGNVVVTQGTMSIKADSIEVREDADGYQSGVAIGGPNGLSRFRQKRDGADEWVEGEGKRIEFNGRGSTLRLVGDASARRLNGTEVADQASGAPITYDNAFETFTVAGGEKAVTPDNPTGRVKFTIAPRKGTKAAAEADAEAASQSASGSSR